MGLALKLGGLLVWSETDCWEQKLSVYLVCFQWGPPFPCLLTYEMVVRNPLVDVSHLEPTFWPAGLFKILPGVLSSGVDGDLQPLIWAVDPAVELSQEDLSLLPVRTWVFLEAVNILLVLTRYPSESSVNSFVSAAFIVCSVSFDHLLWCRTYT